MPFTAPISHMSPSSSPAIELINAEVYAGDKTSRGDMTHSYTTTTGVNKVLIVAVSSLEATAGDNVIDTATWDGDALTEEIRQMSAGSSTDPTAWLFSRALGAAPTGETANIFINFVGTNSHVAMTVLEFDNVDQSQHMDVSAVGANKTVAASESTISITTVSANCMLVDHIVVKATPDSHAAPSNQTIQSNEIVGDSAWASCSTDPVSSVTEYDMVRTSLNTDDGAHVVIALRQA